MFFQEIYENKKQGCNKIIQQKFIKTLTVSTFLDGAGIAERLLFNY